MNAGVLGERVCKARYASTQAIFMLSSLSAALVYKRSLWIALAALSSLGFWVWRSRSLFGSLRDFGVGNTTTSVRALGLLGLAALLDARDPFGAALCAAAVFALDGLDGFLARRTGQASAFGARFDMETDACFVLLLSCGLCVLERAGVWVLAAGALRYLYVLTLPFAPQPDREAPRTRFGRYVFACVVGAFTLCLWPLEPISMPLSAAATALLGCSFARSFWFTFRGVRA
jgi:phosphatidylglycerophosphate synthase